MTEAPLIGLLLPTGEVEVEGFAQAVLVDARNGYTQGTAPAAAKQAVQRITTAGSSAAVGISAKAEAASRAAVALTGEVAVMLRDLRLALAEQRLPQNRSCNRRQAGYPIGLAGKSRAIHLAFRSASA